MSGRKLSEHPVTELHRAYRLLVVALYRPDDLPRREALIRFYRALHGALIHAGHQPAEEETENVNRVCLTGRLTADPEMSYTPAGLAVTKLRLAVRDPFRKDDAGSYATDFFTVKLWRQSAEFAANNLVRGDLVEVSGRLSVDEYTTQEGQKRRDVYVTSDQIDKLTPRPGGPERQPAPVAAGRNTAPAVEEGDFHDPFADQ